MKLAPLGLTPQSARDSIRNPMQRTIDTLDTLASSHQRIPLPLMIARYGGRIQAALRRSLSQDGSLVYDMLRYYMGWADVSGAPTAASAGKAVRPALCMYGCAAVGGEAETAIPAAAAIELIHNFSLVHDDIQDEDETRHNRKTIWAVWGKDKALVAGNVLRVVADTALHELADDRAPADRAIAAVDLLTESYLEMIEGQYLDIAFEGRHDIGMADYRRMISRKTGALLRCSLNLGAAVGSDDDDVVSAFRECGRALGYVFQIRDDVLGVWGDEAVTGKPVGADIRRKKNSYPVVCAMERAERDDLDALTTIYAKPQPDEGDVARALDVMERVGVREMAQAEAGEWADAAMSALASVELSPQARRDIEEFTHFLLVRDR